MYPSLGTPALNGSLLKQLSEHSNSLLVEIDSNDRPENVFL